MYLSKRSHLVSDAKVLPSDLLLAFCASSVLHQAMKFLRYCMFLLPQMIDPGSIWLDQQARVKKVVDCIKSIYNGTCFLTSQRLQSISRCSVNYGNVSKLLRCPGRGCSRGSLPQ